MGVASIVAVALRVAAGLVPVLVKEGKGEEVPKILDAIATLTERGEEGVEGLKALVQKLQDSDGVSAEERAALIANIVERDLRIQDSVASLRDPPGE